MVFFERVSCALLPSLVQEEDLQKIEQEIVTNFSLNFRFSVVYCGIHQGAIKVFVHLAYTVYVIMTATTNTKQQNAAKIVVEDEAVQIK